MAQRVTDGWLFDNARSGYPFGSNFLDFPGSDGGDHLVIKLFGTLAGGWAAAVKLFYLFGFATCFVATYVTARAFGLNRSFAISTSLLYTFVPFHFTRLAHLFYTWYFVAPLFFYLALNIYLTNSPPINTALRAKISHIVAMAGGMLILASFGVYYALFGIIILTTAGVMSTVRWRNLYGIKKAGLLISATIFGVFINVAPNMLGTYLNGPNPEVAHRSTVESEIYGLKMMQLLMPRTDHRFKSLAAIAQRYNRETPLINENATAALGMIGALGFMLILLYVVFAPARKESDERLRLLAATTLVLFLFSTTGGLGSLFAMVISPSIRAWNRNSIFIACGAMLFFFISLQLFLQNKTPKLVGHSVVIAAILLFFGLYDQTAPPCKPCTIGQAALFDSDKAFVHSIEVALPPGGSVYQLPYLGFPEAMPLQNLPNYQLMVGVLQSKALHWSFGGMQGRPGDLFYRALAKEPISRQLEVINNLGFDGIYIDRRGYADNAAGLIQELSNLLQRPPLIQSSNNNLVFFKLDGATHTDFTGLSAKQIARKAGYFSDTLGPRYKGDLAGGVDFTRADFPQFITDAKGLHAVEAWGRWSSERKVVFGFADPLPQKFTLVLKARGYATNAREPTRVEIGDREYTIQLTAGVSEVHLDVDLRGANADSIAFIPPKPVSPKEYSGSIDERKLAIGFVSMQLLQ
jgi:phosphoglycerol transferase